MAKIVSFINQKGGVAKTSSSTIMAYLLANKFNKKVCLIDFDGQGNASMSMGIENAIECPQAELQQTIAEIFDIMIDEQEIPKKDPYTFNLKNVDVIPANSKLSIMSNKIVNATDRDFLLRDFVSSIKYDYDYIIIDSLPKLGAEMVNVLFASTEVIIPTTPALKSVEGLYELIKNIHYIQKAQERRNITPVQIDGILITMANEQTNAYKEIVEQIKVAFGEKEGIHIYTPIIPFVKKWEEGDLMGQLWVEREPNHKASIRYVEFVEEFLKRNNDYTNTTIKSPNYEEIDINMDEL